MTAVRLMLAGAAALSGLAMAHVVPLSAQEPGRVRVEVRSDSEPVPQATVRSGNVARLTDAAGIAVLPLPAGEREVGVEKMGFTRERVRLPIHAGADTTILVSLEVAAEELEGIVVTSTRTGQRIEDEPIRVEVLSREEVEEKMLMTPGDIAMMLNETSGLRVQSTSPSLGGASVRVQGLRGRYTQILSDGLPLYGGQSGALSLLQIPPMDLGQVEVIKGVASSLYGSSALGGVVNLISRRPAGDRELLLNQTTRGGTDGVLWLSREMNERWGYTLLASGHRQGQGDVDDDGWADLPGYRRAVVRPRLFWNDRSGHSVFFTIGAMGEDREGGTLPNRFTPAGVAFPEALRTRRLDLGTVGRFLVADDRLVSVRASGMGQRHDHRFGEVVEHDLHGTGFGEAALSGTDGAHTWVFGAAFQFERYDARELDGFDYTYSVPALFAQDDYVVSEWLTLSASGRLDHHNVYGSFFNPRVTALLRPGSEWTARLSGGTGYYAPTPFTEETEAVGLSRLVPLEGLEAERARSASFDVGRTVGPIELNATLFGSTIEDALQVHTSEEGGTLHLVNATGETRTYGTEFLARYHAEGLHLTATHTFVHSTESSPQGSDRRVVPLTPRNALGMVGMWEAEGKARIGVEAYYTGQQALDENPYRTESEPYLILGALAEWRVGGARLFLNAENLTGVRQTRYHPLLRPSRSAQGRWTTDVWAPLEGRTFNGGIRWEF